MHDMRDDWGKAVFLAGLPTGEKGELIPGHTTWEQLGPKARERYRRMARAAIGMLKQGVVDLQQRRGK